MPATLKEVKKLIKEEFDGSDVGEIKETPDHRVIGTIRWDGFQNMSSAERHRRVTEQVRDKLGLKGINVGILFPLAPGEEL